MFFTFTFRLNVDMLYIFQGTFYITEYQLASILLKGLVQFLIYMQILFIIVDIETHLNMYLKNAYVYKPGCLIKFIQFKLL